MSGTKVPRVWPCPNCGMWNSDGDKKCPLCGAKKRPIR